MNCQICGHAPLDDVLSLGYMPPVNRMERIGAEPRAQTWLPTDLLRCPKCDLVQLGFEAGRDIVFPPDYPYTSGTTKLLRDNFADLAREATEMLGLGKDDLVIDIGSNDGTLLSNFDCRKMGIEPTDVGAIAARRGVPTLRGFFGRGVARGADAALVTATNCFAHMPDVHGVTEAIKDALRPDGVFVSESHYLIDLLARLQYDTIYHEHLRYYSLASLKHLLEMHGLEVFHAWPIPSHGGSIRVYAARQGTRPVHDNVRAMLSLEPSGKKLVERLKTFKYAVVRSKFGLLNLLRPTRRLRFVGIGAPSRASTLINYVGLDETIIKKVCEVSGSLKIGRYVPGTRIPVVDEAELYGPPQPDCAVIFSWHIADEIAPKLRAKGFRGEFIVPLPTPRVLAA